MWPQLAKAIGLDRRPEHTAAVSLALYVEAVGQGREISYSRAKNHYDLPRRYKSPLYTYRPVVGSIDQLNARGLINHDKATPGRRGWQSAMSSTPELVALVHDVVNGEVHLVPLREPVLLRDADKSLLDYGDNRQTAAMRRQLEAQNEAIEAADLGSVLPFPGRLRRIFNGDFHHGGRFYAEGGSWQTLSKAERQRITIDGEPVIEADYTAFHPVLAYAECGLAPPSEPYAISGFPRALVKIAFNVLLNGSSRNGSRHAIAHKPAMAMHLLGIEVYENELPTEFHHRVAAIEPAYAQKASRAADQLIEAILVRHDPIRSMFFSRAGSRLQRTDSDIAEAVMRRMRRQGITVLPIHDSFLVPASKADLLEQAMVEEAAKHGAVVACTRSSNVSVS